MTTRALAATQRKASTSATPAARGFLQRKCACGTHTMGGACEECKSKNGAPQRKLTIGPSSDPLEREADRAATLVAAGGVASAVAHGLSRIQRFAEPSAEGADVAPASVEQALASPGMPLPSDVREDMEQKFGYDFSRVRVHTDGTADQSARAIGANAYTADHQIVFKESEFSPASRRGQRLIAHELAHVVQQSRPSAPVAFQGGESGASLKAAQRPLAQLNGVASSQIVQRQQPAQIEAPNIETGFDPEGLNLPVASADPRSNSDFIDRRLNAVGVGLSGTDFILFCTGLPNPIALPFDYIDLGSTKTEPVDHRIYSGREEALSHVPFGPPRPGGASPFAFYRTIGGLVVPTRFSATSAPETVKLIIAAREKLRQLAKTVGDTLVISVLLYVAAAVAKIGISRWILPRIGAPRELPIAESLPQPKAATPATRTSPRAPVPETPAAPKVSPEETTPVKPASPASGEQLKLFPELLDSAPSRPLLPQPSGPSASTGRVPRVDVAEIKSVESEAAGWRQINGRKYTHKIPDSGHEAVITYNAKGVVRMKVRISGGDEKVIFDEVVGQVSKEQLPSAQYGTKQFGDAIEDPIRVILENANGQKFFIKHPSAKGPDILPPQTSLPVPH
jgi:Domain of unknown function (DUF4157)